jgi:hypothetical protein
MKHAINIDFSKYKELHNKANEPRFLGTQYGWLERHYKCTLDPGSGTGMVDDFITLIFENEQDYIWFKLAHL